MPTYETVEAMRAKGFAPAHQMSGESENTYQYDAPTDHDCHATLRGTDSGHMEGYCARCGRGYVLCLMLDSGAPVVWCEVDAPQADE